MIITIADFRRRVLEGEIGNLIASLQDQTGRSTLEEANAWRDSFTQLARVLGSSRLDPLHLHLGRRGELALEYRLPASSSWCDAVLLGRSREKPAAVILELKHWDTRNDSAGPAEGLIMHAGRIELHPSDQVGGYVEYCRHFHSTISELGAGVDGCVVFTERPLNSAYVAKPNDRLTHDFPCFGIPPKSDGGELVDFIVRRLEEPAPDFARAFERGHYRQARSFVRTIGTELREKDHRSLVLLDEQREGLRVALAQAKAALSCAREGAAIPAKKVLVVQGPPGSGKSAVAAQLWAELAGWSELPDGDLVFVGTSTAQNHAWKHLFGRGNGCIKGAAHFSPATTQRLGQLQRLHPGEFKDVANWRANLKLLKAVDGESNPSDNNYLISIVNEAHVLVNPESPDARGQFGFPLCFGPLGYHIIRASSLAVFFIDEAQSFREREATTLRHLQTWADELGAEVVPIISLSGRQFRCGGSSEYVSWAELTLQGGKASEAAALADRWRALPSFSESQEELALAAEPKAPQFGEINSSPRRFTFELVPSLHDLDAVLRQRAGEGASVRLVSSYAREWKTEKAASPHSLLPRMKDFHFPAARGRPEWSRVWNWRDAPRGYVSWIDPGPGDPMHDDPLCEVGCPYTVRGFDYDYLGLIWLSDVVWRKDHWEVQPGDVHESGLQNHIRRTKDEKDPAGPEHAALLGKLSQGYRILLTRAIKGLYVWCEDEETEDYLRACLGIL